jgi:hypothetical protein
MAWDELNHFFIAQKETRMATQIMNRPDEILGPDKETLYMLGGIALIVFGAGLVISNPTVRRYLSQVGLGDLASSALPDLERYFRLRSM